MFSPGQKQFFLEVKLNVNWLSFALLHNIHMVYLDIFFRELILYSLLWVGYLTIVNITITVWILVIVFNDFIFCNFYVEYVNVCKAIFFRYYLILQYLYFMKTSLLLVILNYCSNSYVLLIIWAVVSLATQKALV